jgi:hypothetical protein
MTVAVKNILKSYEQLPETEKQELATEIIRRSLQLNAPALSDNDFATNADEIFLKLDQRELEDGNA